jgi:hypothetical protein
MCFMGMLRPRSSTFVVADDVNSVAQGKVGARIVGHRAFESTTFGASPFAIQRDHRFENSRLP